MAREIIVLGAGMVGVSIAWHLARRGHSVTLVDRREPGRETSFGNAGIIQREAVQPYAFPHDLRTLLRVLPNREIDIRYRIEGMFKSAVPLLKYWHNSGGSRYESIVNEWATLIQLSLDAHAPMIEAAGAESMVRREGWLELYRTHEKLAERVKEAEKNRDRFGVEFRVLDAEALAEMEPHLDTALVGAIHWLNSWTVESPGDLVLAYAKAFENEGGRVMLADIQALDEDGDGWTVTTDQGELRGDDVVLAMGPWSKRWLEPLGYSVPLFAKRGYHMHYGSKPGAQLNHWIMDAEIGYLLAPMKSGIRLTTGAELERLDAPPHLRQLAAAEAKARTLYPLSEPLDVEPWKGARPCIPDMKPVIGPTANHKGMWCAFGHGHQGFTLGPATGRLLGQMMDGETPDVDMQPFRLERF